MYLYQLAHCLSTNYNKAPLFVVWTLIDSTRKHLTVTANQAYFLICSITALINCELDSGICVSATTLTGTAHQQVVVIDTFASRTSTANFAVIFGIFAAFLFPYPTVEIVRAGTFCKVGTAKLKDVGKVTQVFKLMIMMAGDQHLLLPLVLFSVDQFPGTWPGMPV